MLSEPCRGWRGAGEEGWGGSDVMFVTMLPWSTRLPVIAEALLLLLEGMLT